MQTNISSLVRRTSLGLVATAFLVVPALADTTLPNPLGATTLEDVIYNVSRSLLGLIGIVATFMMIYGGVLYLTSGGNEKQVTRAKEVLKYTTLSIVVILFSAAIVQFVLTTLGYDKSLIPAVLPANFGLGTSDLVGGATSSIRFLLGLLGLAGVAMLLWGGYTWLSAAGDSKKVEKAKQIIAAAVIGIVIILLAWAVVLFVVNTTSNLSNGTPTSFVPHTLSRRLL